MLTESLIRKKFVHDTIRQGLGQIHAQWRPAAAAFQARTGRLRAFADHPAPVTQISAGRYSVHYFIPLHMRFLDIRYRGKRGRKASGQHNLYNRIVWPVLYKEMFPDLRHGFTDEVRRQLRRQLQNALAPE